MTWRTLAFVGVSLVIVGCSGSEENNTLGTPVACATASDCAGGQECGRLDTAGGVTERICLVEAECGELTCETMRCAKSPEGGAAACVAADEGSDPCDGKMCGERCTTCSGDTCPAVEEYCQADGSCGTDSQPACDDANPCADKACGDTCSTCDATMNACPAVEEYCQVDGSCGSDAAPMCEVYDPCAGAICGAACTICDPADTDCVETTVEKHCDTAMVCTDGPPAC